jgi:streptogramin lyase
MATKQIVGSGRYRYEVDTDWGRRAGGVPWFGVSQGVGGDSADRVHVFVRSPVAIMLVLDRNGKLLDSWGHGSFKHPHGVWFNSRDELYLTDRDTHLVTKWTADGRFISSLGERNRAGAPGAPFNQPTKAVEARNGDIYVSDGYGQYRAHRFDAKGRLVRSWGERGTGPSQFELPHDVIVDSRNRVLLCDRTNGRIQVFDREGNYQSEWNGLRSPQQVYERDGLLYSAEGREIKIRDLNFKEIATLPYQTVTPRAENGPHSIWVDSHGDIYLGEVTGEDGLQKFIRQ